MKQIIIVTFFISCFKVSYGQAINSSKVSIKTTGLTTNDSFIPTDSTQLYFPLAVFRDSSSYKGRENFLDKWYSRNLFAMKEPMIYNDHTEKEIYRFTWLRTFHNPVAIRIEKQGESYLLYWKLSNGAGGYSPGKLTIDKQKVVDKSVWEQFKEQLNLLSFWSLKTNERTLGDDGAQWILEGKTGKQYHVVDRWTPGKKSNYYQCCNFLIRLTDLNINSDSKY